MAWLVVALKTVFSLLTCGMFVALCYGVSTDYYLSCLDSIARWTQAGFIYIFVEMSFIAAWFFYKESRWILRVSFIFVLFWLGSFVTCGYIVWQLLKLSPEESLNDPIYFALRRRQRRDGRKDAFSVVSARVIVVFLGCLTMGTSVFVLVIDGFPFHAEVLSSTCMIALIVDLFNHAVVFSVWIGYKESSWINAFIWILLIACFGSITMCAYIAKELFYISPGQPLFLILFNKSNRDLMLSDPLLTKHNNV
ncbi:hypothetical protein R6Q59_019503 [Mikania micrantha]